MTLVTRSKFALKLEVFPDPPVGQGPAAPPLVFKCVNHSSSFALNKIPLASCAVAVGRDARSLEAALIHTKFPEVKKMLRARVILFPSGQWQASDFSDFDRPEPGAGGWDLAGPQVIFDGYVTGIGYKKTRGTLRIIIHLIHWLSDLAFSSIFSNQSHPGNPANLTFRAVHKLLAAGTVGPGQKKNHMLRESVFDEILSPQNIKADLWGKGLAEVMCKASELDLIQTGSPANCGGTTAKNDFALAALARMEGTHSCSKTPYRWSSPLTLGGLGTQGGLLAKAMNRFVGSQYLRAWWATTIWDKLVHDIAPSFMFHIVPRVEDALVAPFVPGLRTPWQVRVAANEIDKLYVTSYNRRPLRGVGIYADRKAGTVNGGGDQPQAQIVTLRGIGGCCMPDPNAKGMMLLRRAPGWLSNVPDFANPAGRTVLGREPGGAVKATGSATTPFVAALGVAAGNSRRFEASKATGELYDNLACYVYMLEILRGRSGMVSGKFRLDIAPGSTVNFTDIGDQHIASGGVDLASPSIYCSVMKVSNALDAEMGKASTVFSIAHVRTETENGDVRTSIAAHPMYDGVVFPGAPLVDEYLFSG